MSMLSTVVATNQDVVNPFNEEQVLAPGDNKQETHFAVSPVEK